MCIIVWTQTKYRSGTLHNSDLVELALTWHRAENFKTLDYSAVIFNLTVVFTALHGMQTRSCDEISVRPSVRLSVKRVHCDKTEESYV